MSCHHFAREPAKSIIFAFSNNLYANDKGDKPIESRIGGKTNVWLAEQLGVNPTTVSKWCTNTCQPDLHTLSRIAELLNVSRRELLRP